MNDVFVVKRPSGWQFDADDMWEHMGSVSLIGPIVDGQPLRVKAGAEDLEPGTSLQDFSDMVLRAMPGVECVVEDEGNVRFCGEPAHTVVVRFPQGDQRWFFLLHGGLGCTICLQAPGHTLDAHRDRFDEVLKTYRFVK
jgi:hypothetical protein